MNTLPYRSRLMLPLAPWLLATGLLASCGAVKAMLPARPKLEKPELSVVDVLALKQSLKENRFRVRLKVFNPNDIEVPIGGLELTVELQGMTFATGSSSDFFTIPAKGNTEFDLEVTTGVLKALEQVSTLLRKHEATAEYRIYGRIHVEIPFVGALNFDKQGVLSRPIKW
ncbi:MAG: LEA type 2 family protein [Magnetococcales bacterium]|nr:LEA type 2 family protein [Magnetococcales bacterium]